MKRPLQIIICALLGVTSLHAQENLLDFWDESPRLFTIAKDGQDLYHDLADRQYFDYNSAYFKPDHADKKVGDFSIVYDAEKAKNPKTFGFVSSLWGDYWELDNRFSLGFFVKVKGSTSVGNVTL